MKNRKNYLKLNSKYLIIILTLFSSVIYSQEDVKKKGNGTFIPDVNNSFKLLQNKVTRKSFEQTLPIFKVKDSITSSYSYNEKTNEKDIFNGIVSQYSFMYKDEYMVYVDVTSKNDIINRLEFYFDSKQDLSKLKSQIIKNGFQYDERLTKVLIKLGYKFCLAYTKKPSYNFTYYNEKKFTISKN